MTPEKRIFLVEDDEVSREIIIKVVGRLGGYRVTSVATTLEEALARIPILNKSGKDGADGALIDGNLGTGMNNIDGDTIAAAIRRQAPRVVVIGIPSFGTIAGAHYNCDKSDLGLLLDTIRRI